MVAPLACELEFQIRKGCRCRGCIDVHWMLDGIDDTARRQGHRDLHNRCFPGQVRRRESHVVEVEVEVTLYVVIDEGSGAGSPLSWLCECAMSNNSEFYGSFGHTHV